jgi:hypothetical protein
VDFHEITHIYENLQTKKTHTEDAVRLCGKPIVMYPIAVMMVNKEGYSIQSKLKNWMVE